MVTVGGAVVVVVMAVAVVVVSLSLSLDRPIHICIFLLLSLLITGFKRKREHPSGHNKFDNAKEACETLN